MFELVICTRCREEICCRWKGTGIATIAGSSYVGIFDCNDLARLASGSRAIRNAHMVLLLRADSGEKQNGKAKYVQRLEEKRNIASNLVCRVPLNWSRSNRPTSDRARVQGRSDYDDATCRHNA